MPSIRGYLARSLKVVSHEEVVNLVVSEIVISRVGRRCSQNLLILERVECRDTQISCIVAKSLAEPLEAY
jgi:hypothetical protein